MEFVCVLWTALTYQMCQPHLLLSSPVKSSTMPAMSPVTSHHYHQQALDHHEERPPPPPPHQPQQHHSGHKFAEIDTSVPGHRFVLVLSPIINIQNELWQSKLKANFKLRSQILKMTAVSKNKQLHYSLPLKLKFQLNVMWAKLSVSRFSKIIPLKLFLKD